MRRWSRAPKEKSLGAFFAFFIILNLIAFGLKANPCDSCTNDFNSPFVPQNHNFLYVPYTPRSRDYSIELGSMSEKDTLYWLAISAGFHLGTCIKTQSETCQQYFELTSGGAGRDGKTHGLLLGSLRWQFVHYPDVWSPFFRVFLGSHIAKEYDQTKTYGAIGIGYGFTTYLHERFDFRFEIRHGSGRQPFSQYFAGLQIKVDKVVDYFSDKISGFGKKTFEYTEKGLKETKEIISSPFATPKSESNSSKLKNKSKKLNSKPKNSD